MQSRLPFCRKQLSSQTARGRGEKSECEEGKRWKEGRGIEVAVESVENGKNVDGGWGGGSRMRTRERKRVHRRCFFSLLTWT